MLALRGFKIAHGRNEVAHDRVAQSTSSSRNHRTEERWARERAAEERAERRQMPPSITVADVAAMIAAALEEERATVLTELADHLAEKVR